MTLKQSSSQQSRQVPTKISRQKTSRLNELTFLLSSGESLFIKIDSLKDSLNALFSQHKIEKSLKLLLLCSCNNRWSDIADGLHATLFPVKGDYYSTNYYKSPMEYR